MGLVETNGRRRMKIEDTLANSEFTFFGQCVLDLCVCVCVCLCPTELENRCLVNIVTLTVNKSSENEEESFFTCKPTTWISGRTTAGDVFIDAESVERSN